MFEAIENVELREPAGQPLRVRVIGLFEYTEDAIESARAARAEFLESGRDDYAWWIVRRSGEQLSEWIADSKSDREFVLDIRSGQLIQV